MVTVNDWLVSKLAGDLGVTDKDIKESKYAGEQIQRYLYAEIHTYSELIEILHGKVGK
jgi:hypothetical protein